jgi:hypothetical protein
MNPLICSAVRTSCGPPICATSMAAYYTLMIAGQAVALVHPGRL